jgi:hypothetical protein
MYKILGRLGQANQSDISKKIEQLWTMVGNTPLIGIRCW